MSVIELTDASKRYGRIQALDSVTLSVKAGEIFGLLGPNGAGKSTLIRLLTGSTRPTSGSITVLGRSPVRDAQAVRREIGYMPQAPALYEDLSARENLRFFGQAHSLDAIDDRITELHTIWVDGTFDVVIRKHRHGKEGQTAALDSQRRRFDEVITVNNHVAGETLTECIVRV